MQKSVIKRIIAIVMLFIIFIMKTIWIGEVIAIGKENPKVNFKVTNTQITGNIGESATITFEISLKDGINESFSDGRIQFTNSNFQIENIKSDQIKEIKDNVILLNSIRKGEIFKIDVPIKFLKVDRFPTNYFEREVTVNLTGKINQEEINEESKIKVAWQGNSDVEVKVELGRCFEQQDKLVVEEIVSTKILNNKLALPRKKEVIALSLFKIDNNFPMKTYVLLNGKEIEHQEISENGNKAIGITPFANETEEIKWNSDINVYRIINVFEKKDKNQDITNQIKEIDSDVVYRGELYGDKEIKEKQIQLDKTKTYSDKNITSFENTKSEIYKGYLYEKSELETIYEDEQNINVIEQGNVQNLVLKTGESFLNNTNVNVLFKEVRFSKENLIDILGNTGEVSIIAFNDKGEKEERTIKDFQKINQNEFGINFNKNIKKLEIRFSKILKNGDIKVAYKKAIIGNKQIDVSSAKEIRQKYVIEYNTLGTTQIESVTKEYPIELHEPEEKIKVTTGKNEINAGDNIEQTISIEIFNTKASEKLLNNLEFKVTLPKDIKSISNVIAEPYLDGKKGEELKCRINGKEITLETLEGINNYQSLNSKVEIRLEMQIDKNATTKDENIVVEYKSQDVQEHKNIMAPLKINNANDFIVKSYINELLVKESQEMPETNIIEPGKKYTVAMEIIGNLDEGKDITMEGNFPIIDQNSKENTRIKIGEITTEENISQKDISIKYLNQNNQEIENLENVKGFRVIVKNLGKDEKIKLYYEISTPEDIGKNIVTAINYKVKYKQGENQKEINAKEIKLQTQAGVEITIIPTRAGRTLNENEIVREGEVITYKVQVVAKGANFEGIKVKVKASSNGSKEVTVDPNYETGKRYYIEKDFNQDKWLSSNLTIKQGEIKEAEYSVRVKEGKEISAIEVWNGGDIRIAESNKTIEVQAGKFSLETYGITGEDYTIPDDANEKDSYIYAGMEYMYGLNIKREGESKEKINLKIEFKSNIPGVEFIEYGKTLETKIMNVTLGEKEDEKKIEFLAKVPEGVKEENFKIYIEATEEKTKDKYYSNEYLRKILYTQIEMNGTSDNAGQVLKNGDFIEYEYNIKNVGNAPVKTMTFVSDIPQELEILSIELNGKKNMEIFSKDTHSIIYDSPLEENSPIKIVVKTKVIDSERMEQKKISNLPYIIVNDENGKKYFDPIEHYLNKNALKPGEDDPKYEEDDNNNPDNNNPDNNNPDNNNPDNNNPDNNNPDNNNPDNSDDRFSISGIAWLDEDKNGIKSQGEKRMNQIGVKIYDVNNKKLLRDRNNQIIETKTNENGEYLVEGLKKGKYILIFDIDRKEYRVTDFEANVGNQSSKVSENTIEIDGKSQKFITSGVIEIKDRHIQNINVGLVELEKFDFKLDKYIEKVILKDNKKTTIKEYGETKLAKVDIHAKKLKNTEVSIEYKIKVTNIGDIPGEVNNIVDYIPKDLEFDKSKNNGWYLQSGKLYNDTLANKEIKPGDSREVRLTLTKKMNEENTGTVSNIAEIAEQNNKYGIKDVNSIPENRKEGENDIDIAKCIIAIETGNLLINISIIILIIVCLSGIVLIIKNKKLKERG